MNVVDFLQDRELLGALPAFKDLSTWSRWLVFLKAMDGLPLSDEEQAIFRHHTGRSTYNPPAGGFPESVAVVGVQSGKSTMAAARVGIAALTGQRGTHAVLIGQDHRGAMRVLLKYSREPFETLPHFQAEVVRETSDTLELSNGVTLSAYPCRPESVRGLRACIVVIDELAFFQTTDGRPTDTEMLRVARGRVAMTGGKILILSSPYGQSGALWDLYRRHYGKDDSYTLVWQGTGPEMNPKLPADYLTRMAENDPDAYQSEVLGQFRAGLNLLLDPENLTACVDGTVRERPPEPRCVYWAFCDPASGTGKDRFVVAVAHHDPARKLTLLDALRVWSPPFSPGAAIEEAAVFLQSYRVSVVTGDRYAPGFVSEQFSAHGITYRYSDLDRSSLYLGLLPMVNAQQVRLLDLPDLLRELRGLERRRGSSGRDKVDHRPGAHDDRANAVAGVAVLVSKWAVLPPLQLLGGNLASRSAAEIEAENAREWEQRREEGAAWLKEKIAAGNGMFFPGD